MEFEFGFLDGGCEGECLISSLPVFLKLVGHTFFARVVTPHVSRQHFLGVEALPGLKGLGVGGMWSTSLRF